MKHERWIIISTPNPKYCGLTKEHISLISLSQMKRWLKQLGFDILKVIGIDLTLPRGNKYLNWVMKRSEKFPKISDILYQLKMSAPKLFPRFARNYVCVAKKL